MNEIAVAAEPPRQADDGSVRIPQDGETAVFTMIDDSLALVAGLGEPLSASAPVLLNGDPGSQVQAVVVSWRRAEPASGHPCAFVALVSLAKINHGQLTSIVVRSGARPIRYAVNRRRLGLDAFLRGLAAEAGHMLPRVVDGLIEGMIAGDASPRRLHPVVALVQAVARGNGCVEVVGRFEEGELFVQGWAQDLPAGRSKVIAIADVPQIAELSCGTFAREDLGGKGHGYCGIIEAPKPLDPARLNRFFYRGRDGWHTIEVIERRVLVEPRSVPGHIRAALPRLTVGGDTLARLRRAANRFDGRDTVSDLPIPVRIGIDLALEVAAGGILVSGWLLDPERYVERVVLRAGGRSVRLDDHWTKQVRPDVSKAFADEPLFAGLHPARHSHGFIVFAPEISATFADPSYVEIVLTSGASTYFPLTVGRASLHQAASRLLGMLDPNSPTAANAVERQFGPMLRSVDRPAPSVVEVVCLGEDVPEPDKTIVVGLDDQIAEAGVLLALLALDPVARALPIVVAGPAETFSEHGGELRRIAGFYGLSFRLVLAEGVEDVCDAIEAGIEAAPTEALVCLSGHIVPRMPGWIAPIERIFRAREGECLVSPTILFEDESIRWAGLWISGEGGDRTLVDHYVGYPRAALTGAEPTEVTAGTMDCCMISKSAFAAAGGFTRGYLGTAEKGLDFALKLRRAGTPSVWVPQVELLCPEHETGAGKPWRRLVKEIDRWAFDARWSLAISNLNG